MRTDLTDIAARSQVLQEASASSRDQILDSGRVRQVDRGATLFLQGERCDCFYIVLDGWVKLYRISPTGSEAILGLLTSGSSFGEATALRREPYSLSAAAASDCTLMRVETAALRRAVGEEPELALAILSATLSQMNMLVDQVERLKVQSGAQRLAAFLLALCDGIGPSCTVGLPYEKVLIAGYLGMKPESLSRSFGRLRDLGVSVRQGKVVIEDIAALRDFAAEDAGAAWGRLH